MGKDAAINSSNDSGNGRAQDLTISLARGDCGRGGGGSLAAERCERCA
jgi:hypothetical protein